MTEKSVRPKVLVVDDEHVIAENKSGCSRCQTGIGVQQRHDHRHVGRADGNDQHDSKDKCEAQHGVEKVDCFGMGPEEDEAGDHAKPDDQIEGVLSAKLHGPAGD